MESEQGQNYWFVICTLRVWLDLIVIFDSNFKCPFCFRSELYTLLLEDILVLLQKQDERLILKCHSKNLAGTADTKHIFSPIIKLSTVLVRSVATGQLTPRLTAYCIITKLVYGFMHVRQNTDLTSVQCLSLQTTSPSSSFPCQTTVHRSMSWWHPQSQIREREAKNFSIELFLSFHCLESRTNVFFFFSFLFTRWQRLIAHRADVMKVKPHSIIPLPQTEYVDISFHLYHIKWCCVWACYWFKFLFVCQWGERWCGDDHSRCLQAK